MAIAVGDRVRPKLTSSTLGAISRLQPQPPAIGTATRLSGGNVLATFSNGASLGTAGVLAAALDQITSTTANTRNAFMDKIAIGLKTDGSQYANGYAGKVVDVFDVNTVTHVVIRTESGMYYELPATLVRVLGGR